MKFLRKHLPALFATILPSLCQGAVFLSVDLPVTEVEPGEAFEVALTLNINGGEQVAAISYFWRTEPEGAGNFRLMQRDTEGSEIAFPFFDDVEVEESPGNLLNPTNALDLGGLTEGAFIDNGEWFVARYTFQVEVLTVPGAYTITSFNTPGLGWATPSPESQNFPFSQPASFIVNVVPEPSSLLLFVFGILGHLFWSKAHARNWDS